MVVDHKHFMKTKQCYNTVDDIIKAMMFINDTKINENKWMPTGICGFLYPGATHNLLLISVIAFVVYKLFSYIYNIISCGS